jgi:1-acyl-sn-glycerol-3-phosphate acyltransferase
MQDIQSIGSHPYRAAAQPHEPPPRYHLFKRLVSVTTLPEYLRTCWGVACYLPLGPPLAQLLGRTGQRAALHRLERWWARRVVAHLRIALDIAGLEQIDPSEAYVVAPLHESLVDPLALFHLPLPLRFAARDELFAWRVLGPYLRHTGQLCVSPERGAWSYRQLRAQARGVFAQGDSLVIFPQGTILGVETDLLGGAFALARAAQRPLLPVALSGGHRVWEHPYTPRLRYNQRISMRVLPPISAAQLQSNNLDEVRVAVRRELKALALGGTMAAPRRFVPERDGYWEGYAYRIDPDFAELAAQVQRRLAESVVHQ